LASAGRSNSQLEHRGTAAGSSLAGVKEIKKDRASKVMLLASWRVLINAAQISPKPFSPVHKRFYEKVIEALMSLER
jgi:hypothetical protein